MGFNIFGAKKMTIVSHENEDRLDDAGTFIAMFNPESYALSYENVYSRKQGINTSGRTARYALSKPERLTVKLILDGTGVSVYGLDTAATAAIGKVKGKEPNSVYKRVQRFLELTSYMDGELHEPKYLTLKWGDLLFKCRLSSVNINYSLFDSYGAPLRAELDTVFFGDIAPSERLRKDRQSSPDLTHYRIVASHDQLPLMCEEIYGAAQYYVHVAKVNNLDDFRNLTPGQEIYFPPIEK